MAYLVVKIVLRRNEQGTKVLLSNLPLRLRSEREALRSAGEAGDHGLCLARPTLTSASCDGHKQYPLLL